MLKKKQERVTFIDIAVGPTAGVRWEKHWLKKIQDLIDWSKYRRKLNRLYSAEEGRPAWPPDMLFRCLLLAEWNGLSDSQLEEALAYRIDYKKFVGLDLDSEVPDATTFVVFRRRIQPIREKLLEILNRQLEDKGYKVHAAVAVDASLVEARSKPHRESDDDESRGGDPDASWRGFPTKKTKTETGEEIISRRPAVYGYKLHASASVGAGFISEIKVTTAKEHEVAHGEDLLREETEVAFMDKGFTGLQCALEKRRIRDGIQKKARRNHPLTARDIERNKRITKSRRIIETVFGCWKLWYRWRKTRYMGLVRNELAAEITAIAWNIKRLYRLETQASA
jgi:IS5 family transposase